MSCCGSYSNSDVLGSDSSSGSGSNSSLSGSRSSKSCSSSGSSGCRRRKNRTTKCCRRSPKFCGSKAARRLQIRTAAQPFANDNRVLRQLNNDGFTRQYLPGGVTPGQCNSNCTAGLADASGANTTTISLYNPKTGASATYDYGTGQISLSNPPQKRKKPKNIVYYKEYKKKDKCKPPKSSVQKRRCPVTRHPPLEEIYPPIRNDCYPGQPKPYELAYNTYFEEGFDVGTSSKNDWNWFYTGDPDNPTFVADDADWDTSDGLFLDSNVFTKTYPQNTNGPDPDGFLDHFKAVAMLNSSFCVRDDGELYAEAIMSANVNPATNQLTHAPQVAGYLDNMYNPGSDPRIAYSVFSLFDKQNQFGLHHVWTNGTLYAAMERMPIGRSNSVGANQNPQAFMSIRPLIRRADARASSNYFRVGVAFDRKLGAKWYVNGALVHHEAVLTEPAQRENILGDYGGVWTDASRDIKNMQVMIGHMSYMDGMNAHQASTIAQAQKRQFVPQDEPPRGLVNLRAMDSVTNRTYSNSTYYDVATDQTYKPKAINYVNGQIDSVSGNPEAVAPNQRVYGQGAQMHVKQLKVQYRC